MNYTLNQHVGSMGDVADCIMIPHGMQDFYSEGTRVETDATSRKLLAFHGLLHTDEVHHCRKCSIPMHANQTFATRLRHLPFGPMLSFVTFTRRQFRCPQCGCTVMENVPFRAAHHRITVDLEKYTEDLLAYGYTNKEVAELTGLAPRTVKDIAVIRYNESLINPAYLNGYLNIIFNTSSSEKVRMMIFGCFTFFSFFVGSFSRYSSSTQ